MKPPSGHTRFEETTCPRCGEPQNLDWDTTPPGRPEYAQAMHGPGKEPCNVVRLGKLHDESEEPAEMLEWCDADGKLTDIDPTADEPVN